VATSGDAAQVGGFLLISFCLSLSKASKASVNVVCVFSKLDVTVSVALLVLATLGDMTNLDWLLFMSHHSRWPRQVKIPLLLQAIRTKNFANVNTTQSGFNIGKSLSLDCLLY